MISRYSANGLTWIDLQSPTSEEISLISKEFNIPALVANEMSDRIVHSKVDLYMDFLYLVLHFPQINHATFEGVEQEIDFIIARNFLITIRYDDIDSINEFAKIFERNSLMDNLSGSFHGGIIFMQLINILYIKCLRQLEEMTLVLKQIERKIFSSQQSSIVHDISKTSRKLLDFKQSIRFHNEVLNSYQIASKRLFGEEYIYYAQRIISEYRKVNNILESQRDILAELQKTNDSLLSSKSNEIMKNFTVMTFVMLPLTLITGVFGMNTISNIIFIKTLSDFYIILGSMLITGIVMFLFFKFRRWI